MCFFSASRSLWSVLLAMPLPHYTLSVVLVGRGDRPRLSCTLVLDHLPSSSSPGAHTGEGPPPRQPRIHCCRHTTCNRRIAGTSTDRGSAGMIETLPTRLRFSPELPCMDSQQETHQGRITQRDMDSPGWQWLQCGKRRITPAYMRLRRQHASPKAQRSLRWRLKRAYQLQTEAREVRHAS